MRKSLRCWTAAAAAALLAACGLTGRAPDTEPEPASSDAEAAEAGRLAAAGRTAQTAARTAERTTRQGLPNAAAAPLEDLNLRREQVPEALAAIEYVYESEPTPDCTAIALELEALTEVLGKDYDTEAVEKSLGNRGGEAAGDFVIDTVRGLSTGWIPYRGWVREATGAAARQRRIARAFTAGHARRAYLKGLGAASGCPPPVAAPARRTAPEEEEPAVEMRVAPDGPSARWGAPAPGTAP